MSRVLLALVLVGLCIASPVWSSLVGPCDPAPPIPVSLEFASPPCPGQPIHLTARACGPCITFLYYAVTSSGITQVVLSRDDRACGVTGACQPESLDVPLGIFGSGSYTVPVELLMYDLKPDSTTCTASETDSVRFNVALTCPTPPPLPFADMIRIGPPPPCMPCPQPPICPGVDIPFFISGALPGSCYQFRNIELIAPPVGTPLPAPPIVRVNISFNDCLGTPCDRLVHPWQASTLLPPLPTLSYNLIVQMAMVSMCDSNRVDTLFTTRVPFKVADQCSTSAPPAVCYFRSWRDDSPDSSCDATIAPGTPALVVMQMWAGVPLAGLQGKLHLDPAEQITGIKPVGMAANMQLAWNALPDGASFVLFSTTGATMNSPCMPPAMCPPHPEGVLEVAVAPRPGVAIPPVALLDAYGLLAADTLGREVPPCPTFVAAPPARICVGHDCDFNADGSLDVRDLVLLARCVTGRGGCPDSDSTAFDCNHDGKLDVDDVLCCARVILHGKLPDSLVTRTAPGLSLDVGTPVVTSAGLDLPIHLSGADLVGASRLALAYPSARFDHASVEMHGDAGSWLQVSEAADGEMVIGLIATAPASQVPNQLDLVVHFGLAAGQTASSDVRLTQSEFVAPDGAVLTPPSGSLPDPPGSPQFRLSPAWPNPSSGDTRFQLAVARAADVDLGIFDLAGRRVATLHHGALEAGDHPFIWNGTRSDGSRAPGGVYFCRVVGVGSSASRSIILLGTR